MASSEGRGWPGTIPQLIGEAARRHPGRLAIADGDRRLTYAELLEASKTFGAALIDAGIDRGDRVAIWCFNGAEWVISLLGLLQAGATLVPINTRFKGTEAADLLRRSQAKALVTVTDFLGTDYVAMLRAAAPDLGDLGTTVVARGAVPPGAQAWDAFLGGASPEAREELERRIVATSPDDVSDILFTSGTTGTPKGVVMTHQRTLCVATDWVGMAGLTADDRYLMVNPYFHMFGLKGGILACVAAGAAMLPEPVLDVDRVLARVEAERVTVLPGAPTLYQMILDHPGLDRYDLSSLRVAVTGSADIPVELIRRIHAELPFTVVVSGYGLTEGGTATGTGPEDDFEAIATTVGRARPGFEIRLVDGGREVGVGETGEVWLRGGSIMSHYLDDPDGTAQALTPDGWLRTGDLGVLDEVGRLKIVGRMKDMFIVGGFNAYPAEIENLLLTHPEIGQAAVIGVPDDRLGEVGMAFVVPRPGSKLTPEDVIAWSRSNMANYKAPRAVEIVEQLPLNASGKVQKSELRRQVAARADGAPA